VEALLLKFSIAVLEGWSAGLMSNFRNGEERRFAAIVVTVLFAQPNRQ
jgi:hypothetical protein